jgi:hypothetical protein
MQNRLQRAGFIFPGIKNQAVTGGCFYGHTFSPFKNYQAQYLRENSGKNTGFPVGDEPVPGRDRVKDTAPAKTLICSETRSHMWC